MPTDACYGLQRNFEGIGSVGNKRYGLSPPTQEEVDLINKAAAKPGL